MYESQNQSITNQKKKCKLPSIQNGLNSGYGHARRDGVYYVGGRMVITLGRDLVLEELLSITRVEENA
jgi:hypothetical protein